jgi:predicted site-specific integrase-resolvase
MSTFDPHSPMFGDITFTQVLEITRRSRTTVNRWIDGGLITPFGEGKKAKFNEDQVVEVETRMAAAARANHERIRERNRLAASRRQLAEDTDLT